MEETIDKFTLAEDTSEEETHLWVNILEMAQAVEQAEMRIETLGQKKRQIKMVSCLADVLQGCVLMVLLLRTDLRVRSVLKLATISQRLGFDSRKGGASGDFLSFPSVPQKLIRSLIYQRPLFCPCSLAGTWRHRRSE